MQGNGFEKSVSQPGKTAKTLLAQIAWWPVAALMLALVFVVVPAQAQYRTSIQGTVADPTGALVPGATLTLTNKSTNETVVRTSNNEGIFNFNALPADHFSLVVTRDGFK
ncbi:MAG: carboxypeptidase-like regulatory domain-containing protein, partial [Terracidiphilus sp.]